jgi:glutaredoxin
MSKTQKFYIYSKSGCGFCDKLTRFLDSKGLQYESFSLGSDFTTEEFLTKFGRGSSFPQVHHNNSNIGGMKDTVRYITEHNYHE